MGVWQKAHDMDEKIGNIAGLIWKYLIDNGQSTTIKIKSALEISNSMMYLALGWLAREGKVDVVEIQNTIKVSLK